MDDTADEAFADKARTLKTKFDGLKLKKTASEAAIKGCLMKRR